ncbi:hypothetical protein L486_03104 [Kwoniella mangroviensis CBS 10435]|uniref:Uncharacterized protein n=1 Tax=Kwoniella mangroviensis CBS 10435 TaxID=1331196 RepID=A0A1B9ISW0_9TREE|nr:hypothetical protein L486_03104 [Kwoniella mangroviensis CBS 10435]
MSTNPPIRSIPIQRNHSPNHRIQGYLASVRPYLEEHAHHGRSYFARVMGVQQHEQADRYTAQHQSMHDRHSQPNKHLTQNPGPAGGGGGGGGRAMYIQQYDDKENNLPAMRHLPVFSNPSRRQYASYAYPDEGVMMSRQPDNSHSKSHIPPLASRSNPKILNAAPLLKTDSIREEENEVAQRKLARKLRRREQASIVKPEVEHNPSPPPRRTSRRKRPAAPEETPSLEESINQDGEKQIRKKRKVLPALQAANDYKPRNVHSKTERLTMDPSKKPGFLLNGKASKPIHLTKPKGKARRESVKAFNENEFLQLEVGQQYFSTNDADVDNFGWEKNYRPRQSFNPVQVQSKRYDRSQSLTHHHDRPAQAARSHFSYRSISRLPPPGVTNSPSWPTGSSEISRSKRNKMNQPPSSVRTLSQVDRDDKAGRDIREEKRRKDRARDEQELLERQREVVEIREREERHRAELERLELETIKRVKEEGLRRQEAERARREQEDLRGITEKKRWKLPHDHPLQHTLKPQSESSRISHQSSKQTSKSQYHPYYPYAGPSIDGRRPENAPNPSRGLNIPQSHHQIPITVAPKSAIPPVSEPIKAHSSPYIPTQAPITTTVRPFVRPSTSPDPGQEIVLRLPARATGSMLPPPVPLKAYAQQPSHPSSSTRTLSDIATYCRTHSRLPPPTPQPHVFGRGELPTVPKQPSFLAVGPTNKVKDERADEYAKRLQPNKDQVVHHPDANQHRVPSNGDYSGSALMRNELQDHHPSHTPLKTPRSDYHRPVLQPSDNNQNSRNIGLSAGHGLAA